MNTEAYVVVSDSCPIWTTLTRVTIVEFGTIVILVEDDESFVARPGIDDDLLFVVAVQPQHGLISGKMWKCTFENTCVKLDAW